MQPDRVFDFEPAAARELQWLPLAVRYKLDACGLKIGLKEWQALALADREALLRCPAGAPFAAHLLALVPGARKLAGGGTMPGAFEDYLVARTA
jgi:hypothetical protein